MKKKTPKQRFRKNDDEVDEIIAIERKATALSDWQPRTQLGMQVKEGKISSLQQIIDAKQSVLEEQIVDALVPGLTSELLIIGQSKGKFGGGAGRIFRQTQKKTREGNKPSFATCAVVGNKDGYVGLGYGKAKETVPAREKAVRNAKLNMIAVVRGSGDWESQSKKQHTIPYTVQGKCGSVTITLIPAPVGTGLVIHPECRKILELAGIKNVWSKMRGHTPTKLNVVRACFDALKNLSKMKIKDGDMQRLHIIKGSLQQTATIHDYHDINAPETIGQERKLAEQQAKESNTPKPQPTTGESA